jgi:hypothetical protein
MTKVLFLDIDGVLNHRAMYVPSRHGSPLCPAAIARLRHVVERTDCRVVLSSTWRFVDHFVAQLRAAGGFPNPHEDWHTVQMRGRVENGIIIPDPRGAEIAEWLSRHPATTRFAIVDDDADMLPDQAVHFVQTSFDTGMTDDHARRLFEILGEAR